MDSVEFFPGNKWRKPKYVCWKQKSLTPPSKQMARTTIEKVHFVKIKKIILFFKCIFNANQLSTERKKIFAVPIRFIKNICYENAQKRETKYLLDNYTVQSKWLYKVMLNREHKERKKQCRYPKNEWQKKRKHNGER